MNGRAFTVIEVLIAIALGMTLCYAAFATARLAGQATALTNRLSTENSLLRSGLHATFDEFDRWTTYDHPTDTTRQPLRAVGRPFQPLLFDRPEFQLDFRHDDPRTWWRGPIYSHLSQRLGDYGHFSSLGDARTERLWYPTMLNQLWHNLGGYALVDYLPASAIYSCFDALHQVPAHFGQAGAGGGRFAGDWFSNRRPRGQINLMHNMGYCVTLVDSYLNADVHRAVFSGTQGQGPWSDSHLSNGTTHSPVAFMTVRPAHIPAVTIKVAHFLSFGWPRSWHHARITMVSPVTGESVTLNQSLTATTLRGARRQRGLDQGSYNN